MWQLMKTFHLYLNSNLEATDWLTSFQKEVEDERNDDCALLKRCFQWTEDPGDPAQLQRMKIHKFMKEAFPSQAQHPIFLARDEVEFNLSKNSRQIQVGFQPNLHATWQKIVSNARHCCAKEYWEDPWKFLEKEIILYGFEELTISAKLGSAWETVLPMHIDWEGQERKHRASTVRIDGV